MLIEIISEEVGYLDPGTGSYILQAILAFFITAGIYARNFRFIILNKIKSIFKK
jgi:hypothetical protein